MTSFTFVRHGKSQANLDGVIGAPDSPLSKEGMAQARRLGRDLKKRGFTIIMTSPYVRARETAEIIAKQMRFDGELQVVDDLRERGFGQLVNRPKDHETAWYYTIDGESDVEPRGMLIARAEAALDKIKKLAATENVLVVGHAVEGFYLRQVASGRRFFDDFDPPKEQPNSTAIMVPITDKIPMKKTTKQGWLAYAAIIAGLICLGWGIWLVNQRQAPAPEPRVKQREIPLYNVDPNLQGATQRSAPQQSEANQAHNGASTMLQPVTSGVPADWR